MLSEILTSIILDYGADIQLDLAETISWVQALTTEPQCGPKQWQNPNDGLQPQSWEDSDVSQSRAEVTEVTEVNEVYN